MKYHEMDKKEVVEALNTDLSSGLTGSDVKKRLKQYGKNELDEGEKQSALLLFFSQFKDFMVLVLLAATLLSGILGEYMDAIAIIAIVVINAFLGFYQERRAEKSLQALKELSAPHVHVMRDGQWVKIPSKEIFPGDVIKFSSGDRIGADVRLVDVNSLEIEESALTGESLPVSKITDPLTRDNPWDWRYGKYGLYGNHGYKGKRDGVVVGTGMKTAMGQIADLLQNAESMDTPLQRRLEQLGKILIVTALI